MRPPVEVQPAFEAAQAAGTEASRRRLEARSYAGMVRPAAEAEARSLIDRAGAEAGRRGLVGALGRLQGLLSTAANARRKRITISR